MNIGIDIDGTISSLPEFFSCLTMAFRQAGHKVYIITYREPMAVQATRDQLDQWRVEYDEIYLCGNTEEMGQWKAKIAAMLELDVMFDDMPQSLCSLGPEVARFWLCDPERYDLAAIGGGA